MTSAWQAWQSCRWTCALPTTTRRERERESERVSVHVNVHVRGGECACQCVRFVGRARSTDNSALIQRGCQTHQRHTCANTFPGFGPAPQEKPKVTHSSISAWVCVCACAGTRSALFRSHQHQEREGMEEHGVEVCGGRLGVVLVHQSGDVVESNCSALKKKKVKQESDTNSNQTRQ